MRLVFSIWKHACTLVIGMETPYLPKSIFGEDFKNVYEPAEDTFLLLDALELELDGIRSTAHTCLEIGSGSGTVITALSKSLSQSSTPRLFIATDLNPHACKTTRKCASYHNQNVEVVRTNLIDGLLDRLEQQVDLIVFNPPYVPTTDDELETGKIDHIYLSWAGGLAGRQLIDVFLLNYLPRLLSKPNGLAFLVALEQNNIQELLGIVLKDNIKGSVVMKRKAGIEMLYILKYQWNDMR